MIINYHKQPTGNTCGPACLKMAHSSLKQTSLLDSPAYPIEMIAEMCETDWVVGTPPDRMEKGLLALDLQYKIHVNEENPFYGIEKCIADGNIVILRTLTQGVPHWIIVESIILDSQVIDDFVNVLDPWLGRILYNKQELDEIWKVRDYFYFEVLNTNANERI